MEVLAPGVKPRSPLGCRGALLAILQAPLPSPRIGLQRKRLFGLMMAFSVSRAAQGQTMPQSRSMASAVYSGRRKMTFIATRPGEVCGGREHPVIPVTMWGSTANRGSHRHGTWHSSFWALLFLRCSWSSEHFVWDHWATAGNPLRNTGRGACCCLGRMRKRIRKK